MNVESRKRIWEAAYGAAFANIAEETCKSTRNLSGAQELDRVQIAKHYWKRIGEQAVQIADEALSFIVESRPLIP